MLDDGAGAFGLGLGLHLRHWGFHSTLKRFRLVLYTEGEGRRELLRQWVSVPRKRGEPLQWWNVKRYARRGIMPHITLEEESGLPSYKDKKDSVNRTLHSQYRGSITETSITILITIYMYIYIYTCISSWEIQCWRRHKLFHTIPLRSIQRTKYTVRYSQSTRLLLQQTSKVNDRLIHDFSLPDAGCAAIYKPVALTGDEK